MIDFLIFDIAAYWMQTMEMILQSDHPHIASDGEGSLQDWLYVYDLPIDPLYHLERVSERCMSYTQVSIQVLVLIELLVC